jgi:hypothetical protein
MSSYIAHCAYYCAPIEDLFKKVQHYKCVLNTSGVCSTNTCPLTEGVKELDIVVGIADIEEIELDIVI